jgi:hypothetical protein
MICSSSASIRCRRRPGVTRLMATFERGLSLFPATADQIEERMIETLHHHCESVLGPAQPATSARKRAPRYPSSRPLDSCFAATLQRTSSRRFAARPAPAPRPSRVAPRRQGRDQLLSRTLHLHLSPRPGMGLNTRRFLAPILLPCEQIIVSRHRVKDVKDI